MMFVYFAESIADDGKYILSVNNGNMEMSTYLTRKAVKELAKQLKEAGFL